MRVQSKSNKDKKCYEELKRNNKSDINFKFDNLEHKEWGL